MRARRASTPTRGRAPRPGLGTASQELLELAFHRASLVNPHGRTKPERDRRRAELKVVRASATIGRHLRLEVRELRPPALGVFERQLVERHFGPGALDRALIRLRRAEERIRLQARDAESAVARADGPDELGEIVRRFYGRLASFVREVEPDLLRLRQMRGYLRDRPKLDTTLPRLVIAGFPNVGKSSLVARLSSARPKVANYPFTTQAIAVGHADLGFDRLQVVDTPGVLGRKGRANPAEVEARTTLSDAATLALFVLDPSGTSGYSVEEQEALLSRWVEEFPNLPILPVETKADLVRRPNDRLHVSAVSGEGIAELWASIRERLKPRGALPPLEESWAVELTEEEPPSKPPRRSARRRM